MNASIASPTNRPAELSGQTVLVIGGSAGIGLATAIRARQEGADVILTGRTQIGSRRPGVTWTHGPLPHSTPMTRLRCVASLTGLT